MMWRGDPAIGVIGRSESWRAGRRGWRFLDVAQQHAGVKRSVDERLRKVWGPTCLASRLVERSTHDALGGMTVESLPSALYKDRASRRAPIAKSRARRRAAPVAS
jgi:hypothetical protein